MEVMDTPAFNIKYSGVPVTRLGLKVASPSNLYKKIVESITLYSFQLLPFNRSKRGVSRFLTLDVLRCNLGYLGGAPPRNLPVNP